MLIHGIPCSMPLVQELRGQDFQRDRALEAGIERFVDGTHPAAPEWTRDDEGGEVRSWRDSIRFEIVLGVGQRFRQRDVQETGRAQAPG
jgi:hypothetical protein